MKADGKSKAEIAEPGLQWVRLKRAGEMLGVKAKTLHNRICAGDFRWGVDVCKPMGRVLMSLATVQRLIDGTHPCQRRAKA